ncbi:hypothetical protein TrLO_g13192 [Triparma laevis f. longispina]|uniref:Uncharacterized protein n=1 Tax=Triparma laevis f. longispina TaxID=1714387 RepID=A0A9W7FA79_9STRA|nr:hypothetical protein TrLO_g13192 [Triparma laevis f. longispina]
MPPTTLGNPPPAKKAKLSGLAAFGFSVKSTTTKSAVTSVTSTPDTKSAVTSVKQTTETPSSNTPDSLLAPLRQGELMYSTKIESAKKRKWVRHAPDKSRDTNRSYCSTDGSSSGWHAAVYVGADSKEARVRAMWKDHQGSNNVGAEAFGFALGVATLPDDCTNCVFLADFLNALAWDVGGANYKHPAIVEAFGIVKATRKANGHTRSNTIWSHCHHPGHKTDDSWFTMLNQVADNMASCQVETDITVSLEVLKELTVQGKGAVDKCKAVIEKYKNVENVEDK